MPSSRIKSPSRSPRWGSWRRRAGSWSGNGLFCRERARYEAERARRQYDAVEASEDRLPVARARSSEPGRRSCVTSTLSRRSTHAGVRKNHSATVWQTAQSYEWPWVRILPRIWHRRHHGGSRPQAHSALCCAGSRARSKAGARSGLAEDCLANRRNQRALLAAARSHPTGDYIDLERLRRRITELNNAGKMDKEIAASLNQEGFPSPPAAVPSRAKMFGYCVPAGRSRLLRSMAPARTRCAGLMALSRFRAWQSSLGSRHKPCSTIWLVAIWLATS